MLGRGTRIVPIWTRLRPQKLLGIPGTGTTNGWALLLCDWIARPGPRLAPAMVQARLRARAGRGSHLVVEADRRPAHARSRSTAAVAATMAAAEAIKAICQPGMPPI
jgi:hypothetical protein